MLMFAAMPPAAFINGLLLAETTKYNCQAAIKLSGRHLRLARQRLHDLRDALFMRFVTARSQFKPHPEALPAYQYAVADLTLEFQRHGALIDRDIESKTGAVPYRQRRLHHDAHVMRRNIYRPCMRVVIRAEMEDGTTTKNFAFRRSRNARKKSQVMRRHIFPFVSSEFDAVACVAPDVSSYELQGKNQRMFCDIHMTKLSHGNTVLSFPAASMYTLVSLRLQNTWTIIQ
jgi:hypothetical protein